MIAAPLKCRNTRSESGIQANHGYCLMSWRRLGTGLSAVMLSTT